MNSLQTLTSERLKDLIDETEATLVELKEELERRQQLKQSHEIANLEHHMKSTELSLRTIRDFLAFLSTEVKAKSGSNKH